MRALLVIEHVTGTSAIRLLMVVAVIAISGLVGSASDASCIAQQSIKEVADRADAVVFARVEGFEGPPGGPPGRFGFVRVERVYKGSAYGRIGVGIGPESGSGGISPAATSIDYQMSTGTAHTLYLKQHAPAGYTTDACSGSHPGPPTAEEEAFFGPGRAPDRTPTGIDSATGSDTAIAAAATLIALAAGVGAIVYAQRTSRRSVAT